MPHLLLNLRHVPDDEADEVRALLEARGIEFYETPASWWGVSGGGLWLPDDGPVEHARELLDAYQRARAAQAREAPRPVFRPLRTLLYLAIAGLILYVSVRPFFAL